ncbi:MAG TPA: response regulator [Vicinamibacterales bacterium]|nr:response regulator [Vicinamibacterales bacterium]
MIADAPLILVVEDERGAATLQRRRLERAGFRVAVAADADQAEDVLAREAVTLVVMDYRLGTTTGLDLNRRMKAAGYDVPTIIVSGSIDDTTVIEAIRAGVKDVVVKTLDYLDYLPDAIRGVLSQTAAVRERVTGDAPGTHVLVVEDDPGVAALQRRQLERAGYHVDVAATPAEALARVRSGQVNLAVLDLWLNGESALDLYEQIKSEGWNVPAILVTGFPDQAVAIRALRTGIRDFVPKSSEYLEYLPRAVDRVVAEVRVERKLVESELRLASIIGTTMDAILMCDEQHRILLFNRSAEEMFGCRAEDALARQLPAFIPELSVARRAEAAGRSPESGWRRRLEVEGVRSDGTRIPIEVTISDVEVHARRLFTVIARDISERRRTEAELREADRRKDVFLGMLAHELRNPLAAITTAGEVLHRTLDHPAAQKLTGVIRRQTAALARMVDDLLDVSRVTLGKIQLAREPLLLGEVVTRAAEGARDGAAKADLRLEVAIGSEPVWLIGDATRLEQVLANLLNNAMKFTPPGGSILIETGRDGDEAVIRVSDTGVGIEPGLLSKVFDLFVQGDTSLDRSRSGLGIGLALVRQVVSMHGGRVSAHSEGPGRGSVFVVRLPASPEEAPSDEPRAQPPRAETASLRVLVVDDQPDLADCVALLIETLGHRARAVYGGAEALAATRTDLPDLMLVDIGMPGVTGYDVARAVRRDPALSGIRLAALTGYGRDEDRARVFEAGFDLHLTKPVADTKLRDVLETLAGARTAPE